MNSRKKILTTLREARRPFEDVAPPPADYIPMVPMDQIDPAALKERFVAEAEKLACVVHHAASPSDASETILELIGEDQSILSWELDQLPLPGLGSILQQAGVSVAAPDDPDVRVGLSGAESALAATGSLVMASGAGKYRNASLLPPVHIAVITTDQILPDMESWLATHSADQLETLRQSSNVVIVSGPSRTADIAMELILGMHGPGEMHIVLIES